MSDSPDEPEVEIGPDDNIIEHGVGNQQDDPEQAGESAPDDDE